MEKYQIFHEEIWHRANKPFRNKLDLTHYSSSKTIFYNISLKIGTDVEAQTGAVEARPGTVDVFL